MLSSFFGIEVHVEDCRTFCDVEPWNGIIQRNGTKGESKELLITCKILPPAR